MTLALVNLSNGPQGLKASATVAVLSQHFPQVDAWLSVLEPYVQPP